MLRTGLSPSAGHIVRGALLFLVLSDATPGLSQSTGEAAPPPTPRERPGLLRMGPFYVTPRLNIGNIGLDTNVFYTPTERQTDFIASGGPGLDLVLPMGDALKLTTAGNLYYLYFARTESQRRWSGDGRVALDLVGAKAEAQLEAFYRESFSRPNFEVDRRVVQEERWGAANARLEVGERLELRLQGKASRLEVLDDEDYLGQDLRRNLSRDTYLGILGLGYRVTPKTSLLLLGDYQVDRFRFASGRDGDSNRAYAGFEIESKTRLAGKAVGGVRSFRPVRGPVRGNALEPYADINLIWHFGPRTRLIGSHNRDLTYSAFITSGPTPTMRVEGTRLELQKGLWAHFDIRLYGALTHQVTDGAIRVVDPEGNVTIAVRDDDVREAGANLGYTFRTHFRIGVGASYTDRQSTFEDFGIEGLLIGGTITYNP